MFGVSFTELLLIGAVTLMIVGPSRLPQLLGTLGRWSAKLRRITTEVRYQSGIDDILRKEGISGGLSELRNLRNAARGGLSGLASSTLARPAPRVATSAQPGPAVQAGTAVQAGPTATAAPQSPPPEDPFVDVAMDPSREYPAEGCDAYGALPDDMWSPPGAPATFGSPAAASPAGDAGSSPAAASPAGDASSPAGENEPVDGSSAPRQ